MKLKEFYDALKDGEPGERIVVAVDYVRESLVITYDHPSDLHYHVELDQIDLDNEDEYFLQGLFRVIEDHRFKVSGRMPGLDEGQLVRYPHGRHTTRAGIVEKNQKTWLEGWATFESLAMLNLGHVVYINGDEYELRKS